MEAIIKRCVFTDEWFKPKPRLPLWQDRFVETLRRLYCAPVEAETQEFKNYALGFRFSPTSREMEIIQTNNLFSYPALKLRDNDAPITFGELLGPEFVPEVNPSQAELLGIEGKVRQAAISWTHFFKSIDADA